MTQTRTMSFVESWVNILVGYTVNFTANMIILPMFGFDIKIGQNIIIGLLYTIISLVRSYCIRRVFNGKERQSK